MNRLVMDYLVGKGYRDVAEAFWRDSNTKRASTIAQNTAEDGNHTLTRASGWALALRTHTAPVDLQSVQERMSVQELLLDGHIQRAREKLQQIDPQVRVKRMCASALSLFFPMTPRVSAAVSSFSSSTQRWTLCSRNKSSWSSSKPGTSPQH